MVTTIPSTNGHTPVDVNTKAESTDEDKQMQQAAAYSMVVNLPPYWGNRLFWGSGSPYAYTLPGIDHIERQAYLGALRYHPQNALFQAAYLSLQRQVTAVGYELKGKRRVDWYQSVLNNADRGRGWSSLVSKILWDFTTLDDGAVIEVIGKGAPDSELKRELVTGIGYLDPLRCYFTDNFEYPVWYQDYYGKLHKIHYTRVIRWVDQPLGAQEYFGRGFSALSRAVAWVQQAISTMTYTGERLNDEPPAGIFNIGKLLNETSFKQTRQQYEADRRKNGDSRYRPPMVYHQPGDKAEMEFIPFTDAPAAYDFEKYVRLQAQGVASALGIDPQDILPLVSGSFGTGKEAEVLNRKAHGKTLGYVMRELTRFLNNRVLPGHLEFSFKYEDSEQSIAEAEKAKMHMDVATQLSSIAGSRYAIQYLANTVEAFRDVLLDDEGQIRLYDDDVDDGEEKPTPPEGQPPAPAQPSPGQPQPNAAPIVDDTDTQDVQQDAPITDDDDTQAKAYAIKAYEDTLTAFAADMYSAIEGANDGDYNRRRAGVIIRANIAKHGRTAYLDGLAEGGFDEGILDAYDSKRYQTLVTEASGYVSNLTERIYSKGMSEAEIRNSVTAWGNKTLYKFFLWGLESADKNTLMIFTGKDGKESCKDCKRLKNKIYRMYEWAEARLRPGVDTENFECGGWECEHRLERAKKGSRRSRTALKMLAELIHQHVHAA